MDIMLSVTIAMVTRHNMAAAALAFEDIAPSTMAIDSDTTFCLLRLALLDFFDFPILNNKLQHQ